MTDTVAPRAGRGWLPAEVTSFVGRRRELAATRQLLGSSRLVTLTGVGGVGKSRLALRTASGLRRSFSDGVWFVELAPLQDSELLPHTLARVLELPLVSADPMGDLAVYLEDKMLLVVLDNCEHLTQDCAVLVNKLLAAAPRLRFLVTSRHVLGVDGEQILQVPPLSTPDLTSAVGAAHAGNFQALELFEERGQAADPEFAIVPANRAVVVELCQKLDGLPLAIELAAVWLRILSPAQLLERLDDRFALLASGRSTAPSRQQALAAAIDWSFELCSPAEQRLWARLSVFAGGFDLQAAEEVCSGQGIDSADVLALLASLVNKSVIIRQPTLSPGSSWYRALETIRQYGADRLEQSGERRSLRRRHRDYYVQLAHRAASESFSPHQTDWYLRLRREHDNFRAALDFCLADAAEVPVALEIASDLRNFWFAGFLREGHQYLVRALELASEQTPGRATALWTAASLATLCGELDQADTLLDECTELAERFDDDLLRARIKECRGQIAAYQGDLSRAVEILEEGLAHFRSVGDPHGEFDTVMSLAGTAFCLAQDSRLHEYSRQALELAERHGAPASKANALWGIGLVQWRASRLTDARRSLREAIRLLLPVNDLTGISVAVQTLSWVVSEESPDEDAARLLGAAQAVWRMSGAKVGETTIYNELDRRSEKVVRQALGPDRFDEAFAEGSSYTFEQAVNISLGRDKDRASPEQAADVRDVQGPPAPLTARELEVARLLAEGLSNKEIAARLVISRRTAEAHVENILAKLGLTSRTQVSNWLVR